MSRRFLDRGRDQRRPLVRRLPMASLVVLLLCSLASAVMAQDPEPLREPQLKPRPRLAARTADENEPYRSPGGAATRSLVWPGWGQFDLGDSGGGALFTSGALVALALGFELIELSSSDNTKTLLRNLGWGLYAFDATLAAVDAYRRAREINRENGYELFEDELGDGRWPGSARARAPVVRLVLWSGRF